MRLNLECMRKVLTYLIDNLEIEIENRNGSASFQSISAHNLCQKFETEYDKKDVLYTVYNLCQCGYLVTSLPINPNQIQIEHILIFNVTFDGHQFAEIIREPKIWDRTKSVLKEVGTYSIQIVANTAQSIATGLANGAIMRLFG